LKIFLIAGARPNFMKIAPIYREGIKHENIDIVIVHTGQHYDFEMSKTFFNDLDLPEPGFFLNVGSGTHASQTAKIMVSFEKLCKSEKPDLIIVVGDVNSTMACSIVAKKCWIDVAHVEAGLRSFDLLMPEEINRIVTDAISDYFFVTEDSGVENLLKEGKSISRIFPIGNVMIDNLFYQLVKLADLDEIQFPSYSIKNKLKGYFFLTLHRPSNVDFKNNFIEIVDALNEIAKTNPIVFPVHPRTRKRIEQFNLKFHDNFHIIHPLSFTESLYLWKDAEMIITDSGGLQEETTALGIPCMTIRENTERPITVRKGTNILAGVRKESILKAFKNRMEENKKRTYTVPDTWDGKAAKRMMEIILNRQ